MLKKLALLKNRLFNPQPEETKEQKFVQLPLSNRLTVYFNDANNLTSLYWEIKTDKIDKDELTEEELHKWDDFLKWFKNSNRGTSSLY